MNLNPFSWFFKRATVDVKNPRDPVLATWFGGASTAAGQTVTSETALTIGAVYAAVRVLSESVAVLPLVLFDQIDERTKERAVNHPLFNLLKLKPNAVQTSFEYREMMMGHLLLRGNAYAVKEVSNAGQVVQLLPIDPDLVTPFWIDDSRTERAYKYTRPNGGSIILLQDEMHHVAGLSFDGLSGVNPIAYNREMLGKSMAENEYSSRLLSNDATPPGILTHPGHFDGKESRTAFAKAWKEAQTGANRGATAVLEDGMRYEKISLTPEETQFLESKKFSVTEIARMFRIPPHLIGDLSKSSFNNITQQSLEFVRYSLMPWLVRWEQAITRDLLTEAEAERLYPKHIVAGMLRGDTKERYDAYHLAITDGYMTRNEARELEDMNPLDGLDEPLVPMNMGSGNVSDDVTDAGTERMKQIINSTAERISRKEVNAIAKAMQKYGGSERMYEWVREFYSNHAEFVSSALVIDMRMAQQYTDDSQNELCSLLRGKDFEKINAWQELRVNKIKSLGELRYRVDNAPVIHVSSPDVRVNVNDAVMPDVILQPTIPAPNVEVVNQVRTPSVEVINEVREPVVNVINEIQPSEVDVNVNIESPNKTIRLERDTNGDLKGGTVQSDKPTIN